MAVIQVDFFSSELKRTVPIRAIIPNDPEISTQQKTEDSNYNMKTLYLLHGYYGSCSDWLMKSQIIDLAGKYNLAVIMPQGENSFYLDDPDKNEYFGRFTGIELVDYSRRLFHLSSRRKDTYIAGLSMGGYGALRNGLYYPETFSKIISFSGALIHQKIIENNFKSFDDIITPAAYKERIFGNLKALESSDRNPVYLAKELVRRGKDIPDIMMSCGTEDPLRDVNRIVKSQLERAGINLKYIESRGTHDWNFWNKHLEEAVVWLMDSSI